jgi:rare lipoprotein A
MRRKGLRWATVGLAAILVVGGASGGAAAARPHKPQIGAASYYSRRAAGKETASGTRFAPNRMTAASRTLPLGTRAKVTNTETGKSVHVTVTDRGPFAKGRILDVSPKAAHRLGMTKAGVSTVKVQPVRLPAKGE